MISWYISPYPGICLAPLIFHGSWFMISWPGVPWGPPSRFPQRWCPGDCSAPAMCFTWFLINLTDFFVFFCHMCYISSLELWHAFGERVSLGVAGVASVDLPGGRMLPLPWSAILSPLILQESNSTTCVWWVARTWWHITCLWVLAAYAHAFEWSVRSHCKQI